MTKLEEFARAYYDSVRVTGQKVDWPSWEDMYPVDRDVMIAGLRVAFENLKHGNFAMAGAATRVTTLSRWTPHMLWDAVIDAILEEKPSGE